MNLNEKYNEWHKKEFGDESNVLKALNEYDVDELQRVFDEVKPYLIAEVLAQNDSSVNHRFHYVAGVAWGFRFAKYKRHCNEGIEGSLFTDDEPEAKADDGG